VPKARELRKDEPHPVGPLTSIRLFLNNFAVDVGLGVYEANEISVCHLVLQFTPPDL
jgi:hypothetical protein